MADAETAENKEPAQKRRTGRSPSYPSFSIKKALEQAEALRAQEGEYEAPLPSAFKAWGYGMKSSGGRQCLATMKYYGLIDISGGGHERKVKVSDLARRILLDRREDQAEKKALIRQAALNPAAHKAIFKNYPNGLGSDGSIHHFLTFEEDFKEDAASDLIAEFKETADFAELYQPHNPVDKNAEEGDNGDGDGGGGKVDSPLGDKGDKPRRRKLGSGMKEATFPLDEGMGVIQWPEPLSQESYEDFEQWVQLVLRKVQRSVGKEAGPGEEPAD